MMVRGDGSDAGRAKFALATIFALTMSALISACSLSRPAPPPAAVSAPVAPQSAPTPRVFGVASWYGPGFHGHRTSSGAIYNQEDLTAASTVFPVGSRVVVTNLDNGRSVEVVVNDRGPFKKGRKIDLSHKAARVIGMLDKGTAPVRIDLVSAPVGSRPVGAPERYFVQLGSFSERANAERLRERMTAYYRDVSIVRLDANQHRYYRVRMGAFATRDEAQARASDSRRFGLPIVIVVE